MAEAFGVTESTTDILQLTEKLVALGYEYIAGIKNVPDDLRQLLNELLSLSNVLFMLQEHLQNLANSTAPNTVLGSYNNPMSECTLDLKQLKLKLELKKRIRGKMTCLMWPLKKRETIKWISQLVLYNSQFTLIPTTGQSNERYARDTNINRLPDESSRVSLSEESRACTRNFSAHSLQTDSKGQCTRAERQAPVKIEKDQNSILNWLSPGNFDIKHLETSGERLGGTGKWLMETLEFDHWIKGRPDYLLLWGYGIPVSSPPHEHLWFRSLTAGSGKTYLSSLVIDRLQMIKASSENYGLAYIYFDYIEKDRQGPIQVMASLIKQLSTQTSTLLPDETRKLYNKLKREEREPDFEELYRVFLATCGKFSRVFLVFDALDECDQDGGQGYLLRSLQNLLEEKQQISIFLTSQPYSEAIQRYLHYAPKIEVSAHQEDIGIYIEKKIGENARAKRLIEQSKFKNKIICKLAECAKGTFLRVIFHIELICQQATANQIFTELNELNILGYEESRPLDFTYDRIMNIIYKKPAHCKELALKVFSWLVKAKRKLTAEEIQEAVSITLDASGLDPRDIPDQSILLDACAGLVKIDKNGAVRFAHYTIQEYILKNNILPADTDFKIAAACASYLLFDDFNCHNFLKIDSSGLHTFLGYACDYVFSHLRCCDHPLTATSFLNLFEKVNHGIMPDCGFHLWPSNMPLGAAIDMGLYNIARQLLEMGCDLSPLNSYSLHKAVIEDSREIIQILLENGVESSVWDDNGMAPLHLAAIKNNIEVVRLFLQYGADISIQDGEVGLTALHMAVSRGHNGVVSLLLENGADVSIPDDEGQTAIHSAVLEFRKNPETLSLILQMSDSGDVWAQDQSGCTAFHLAATHGFDEVIQLFIDNGIDFSVPVKTNSGSTPLHKAALRGHKSFVQLLIRAGAVEDISIQDNHGRTALHLASRGGQHGYFHPSSVQKYQSNVSHRGVILALLENGADMTVQDNNGLTAVDEAVSRGNLDILQLFLEEGADLSLFQDHGSDAFYLAASLGSKEVAGLLIKEGVDIWKISGDYKQTALHGAASGGHYEIVKSLLDTKSCPEISLQDILGQTALHIATQEGHYEIARLLRERDINIELRTVSGQTAADIAASTGHTEIARLILENEVPHPPREIIFHDTGVSTTRQGDFMRRAGVWAAGNMQASQGQVAHQGHRPPHRTTQAGNQETVPDENTRQQSDVRITNSNKRARLNEASEQMCHSEDILKKPRTDTEESSEALSACLRTSSEGSTRTKISSFDRNAEARNSEQ